MAQKAIGIDIGGTGMKGALIDVHSGQLLSDRFRIPTPEGGRPDDVTAVLKELISQIPESGSKTPVGIAFPSRIVDGVTHTASNIDQSWIGLNAQKLFEQTLGRSVNLVNDADAAGYAEAKYGAAKKVRGLVIMITLGTGIGSALLFNGKLIPNSELGHVEIDGIQPYERVASTAARERQNMTFEQWAVNLQRYFTVIENLLSPTLFVVGGGVSKRADEFLPLLSLRTPIIPAVHRNNSGILGAGALA